MVLVDCWLLWSVFGGFGWLLVVVDGIWWLLLSVVEVGYWWLWLVFGICDCWLLRLVFSVCCWLLMVVVGCWLLIVVVGCWLLMVVVGCWWLWLDVGGCGWLMVVVVVGLRLSGIYVVVENDTRIGYYSVESHFGMQFCDSIHHIYNTYTSCTGYNT